MGIAAKKKKRAKRSGQGHQTVFPWSKMKRIGASFYLKGAEKRNYVYSSLICYNKKRGKLNKQPIKITMITEKHGIRVWRTH